MKNLSSETPVLKQLLAFFLTFIITLAFIFAILPVPASANAAEPPSVIFIMAHASQDVEAEIISEEVRELKKITERGEVYFTLYRSYPKPVVDEIVVRVTDKGASFDVSVPKELITSYNQVITINMKTHEVTEGSLPSRTIKIVAVRVALTLLVEGVVFFLFGFRKTQSWIIFLVMNLITQAYLNYSLLTLGPLPSRYGIFITLIIVETIIFLGEMLISGIFLKEKSISRRLLFALVANISSYLVGWFAISYLPF